MYINGNISIYVGNIVGLKNQIVVFCNCMASICQLTGFRITLFSFCNNCLHCVHSPTGLHSTQTNLPTHPHHRNIIGDLPICPSIRIPFVDNNREPQVIYNEVCQSRTFSMPGCRRQRFRCQEVTHMFPVLRFTSCVGGIKVYSAVLEPVSTHCSIHILPQYTSSAKMPS